MRKDRALCEGKRARIKFTWFGRIKKTVTLIAFRLFLILSNSFSFAKRLCPSDRYVSVVMLLLGVLILWMSLMTWMKINHFNGSLHFSQRAMMIPQVLIGTTTLWTGIVFWFNRIYTYRLFLRQGRKRITLGIRVPMKWWVPLSSSPKFWMFDDAFEFFHSSFDLHKLQ